MRLKIWRFISIYLTAITLSLTFSHLLEMPQKFKYDWTTIPLTDSWMDTSSHWEFGHAISAVLDLIGFGALIASVLFDRTAERANG